MWPRIIEILLAFWLFFSSYIFGYHMGPLTSYGDSISAALVLFFALFSLRPKWNKLHLCSLLVAVYLCVIAYLHPTPFLPFYLQSHLIVANILFMTALIPNRASESPEEWVTYINNKK